MRVRKTITLIASAVVLIVLVLGTIAVIRIGPGNIWGMLRYDQRREGDLAVGDQSPDVLLTALDGVTRTRLHEHIGKRPLVLIFGSFT